MSVFKESFRELLHNNLAWAALIAIPLLIGLFGSFYVDSFKETAENMSNVPVAVINLDEGATVDGEQHNYGSEMVDRLMENDDLAWEIASPALIERGLENSDFYLALIIPPDFSESIAAGEDGDPEQAQFTFWRNEAKNYTLAQLSVRADLQLEKAVQEEISRVYAQTILDGLTDASDGLTEASDGAAKIVDGAGDLGDGATSLSDGATELSDGATTLGEGLGTAIEGTGTMSDALTTVGTGLTTLKDGLESGSGSLADMGTQLAGAATGIGDTDTEGTLRYGVTSANNCIAAAQAALAGDGTYNGLSWAEWLQTANGALTTVDAGLSTLKDGLDTAATGATGASSSLSDAASSIGDSQTEGETLAWAVSQVSDGLTTMGTELTTAQDGATSLANGATTLADGATTLAEGAATLAEGATTLQTSLSDGAATITDALPQDTSKMADYIADPVELNKAYYGKIDFFGFGFAPFFMTMALWLGALMVFFVFDAYPLNGMEAGSFRTIFGRLPLFLLFGALEVAAVYAGANIIDLPILDYQWFVLTLVVASVTFMLIIHNLNLIFGLPGKFLAILMMILQLVSSNGTIPAILSTEFVQDLSPWMPYTYAIEAFRQIMSGGDWDLVGSDLVTLALFGAGALALSLAFFPVGNWLHKRAIKREAERKAKAMEGFAVETNQVHYDAIALTADAPTQVIAGNGLPAPALAPETVPAPAGASA